MTSPIRYRYALDADSRCCDVTSVDPAMRGSFRCYGCGQLLIAHLGKKKAWHFQHKVTGTACGRETYLHKLAKAAFIETYSECLAQKRPYYLTIPVRGICTHYLDSLGLACDYDELQRHDLTKTFDRVNVEARCGNLVADALLSSSKNDAHLLIEFAVTHRCDPEKIDSGLRIVEVLVQDEGAVDQLRSCELTIGGTIASYNLRLKPTTGRMCGGECEHSVFHFVVYESGKALSRILSPQAALKFRRRKGIVHHKIVPHVVDPSGIRIRQIAPSPDEQDRSDPATLFQDESVDAYYKGIPIKSCYVCRYHGTNGVSAAIWCKLHKAEGTANSAAECAEYRPVGKQELKRIEAKNRQWMKEHGMSFALSSILKSY